MNHDGQQHFWVENSHRKYSGLVQTAEVCSKIDRGDTCIGQNKSHLAVSQHITRWWHVIRVHLLTQVRGFQKTTLHEISERPQPHRDLDLTSEELHLYLSEFWWTSRRRSLLLNHFFRWLRGWMGKPVKSLTDTCIYIYSPMYNIHVVYVYNCIYIAM